MKYQNLGGHYVLYKGKRSINRRGILIQKYVEGKYIYIPKKEKIIGSSGDVKLTLERK